MSFWKKLFGTSSSKTEPSRPATASPADATPSPSATRPSGINEANKIMANVIAETDAVESRDGLWVFARSMWWITRKSEIKEKFSDAARQGANLDIRDSARNTLLHSLAADGCLDAVLFFLSLGASPNVTLPSGETSIDIVRKNGHHEIVRLLEDEMARQSANQPVETPASETPSKTSSPPAPAPRRPSLTEIERLVSAGPGGTWVSSGQVSVVWRHGGGGGFRWCGALTLTSRFGEMKDQIAELVRRGAHIDELDSQGFTLLHWVAVEGADREIIQFLLDLGAVPSTETISIVRNNWGNEAAAFLQRQS